MAALLRAARGARPAAAPSRARQERAAASASPRPDGRQAARSVSSRAAHLGSLLSGFERAAARGTKRSTAAPRAEAATYTPAANTASVRDNGGAATPFEAAYEYFMSLVQFTRPHTMIGTVLSIVSVSFMAVQSPADLSFRMLDGIAKAIAAALCMNVAIVGFNQLCDVDIDKINKPMLPLASGRLSIAEGNLLVVLSCAAALALGYAANSPPLLWTLVSSAALGFFYSADLPLMRWKRSPFLAAACIFGVRALAVQFGFYFHMTQSVLQRDAALTFPLLFASAFMSLFSVVIALFKDIPDVKGDQRSSIRTLSVRLGEQRVLDICVALLLVAYTGAIAVAMYSPSLWCRCALVVAHALMARSLWRAKLATDTSSVESVTAMYMKIWTLFYLEYLLLPLVGR